MVILDDDGVESKGECRETFSEDLKLPKKDANDLVIARWESGRWN